MASIIPNDMFMQILQSLALCGAYAGIGLAAVGSGIGAGLAGCSAVGAWKKRYLANKSAPFMLVILAGMPLSQTIYAMVLMMIIKGKVNPGNPQMFLYMTLGIFSGVAMLVTAIYQGKAAAAAADAYAETDGKGIGNYIMVIGIVETVSLFALIFGIMVIPADQVVEAAPAVVEETAQLLRGALSCLLG